MTQRDKIRAILSRYNSESEIPSAGRVVKDAGGDIRRGHKVFKEEVEKMFGIQSTGMGEPQAPNAETYLGSCDIEKSLESGKSGFVRVSGKCRSVDYIESDIVEKAKEEAGIDERKWYIAKTTVKKWDTGMKLRTHIGKNQYKEESYQITNWAVGFEIRPNKAEHFIVALERVVDKPPPVKIIRLTLPKKDNKMMAVYGPADVHIAKYAWGAETLGGDMDVPIVIHHYLNSGENSLNKIAMFSPAKIFMPVGQDLMHIENQQGETHLGKNKLDFDTRLPYIIEKTEEATIKLCDMAAQIAPVEIIWLPGNHDWHASYWLCRVLNQRYRNEKHITVELGPSDKKMIQWGKVLIGMVHDAEGRKKVPTVNLMAQEEPWKSHWSSARWTELHTGHLHKREVMTIGKTIWRRLSALSTVDFWHSHNLFTDALPACESFLYHADEGLKAEFVEMIDYQKEAHAA